MTRLKTYGSFVVGGLSWSVSYLVLTTFLLASVHNAVVLMWVLKIAWSAAHTAVSHGRGRKAAAAARCATCCTCA